MKGKKRISLLAVLVCLLALVLSLGLMSACGNTDDDTTADNQWYYGAEVPADTLGNEGDYYLNTQTLASYVKSENGTWTETAANWYYGTEEPVANLGATNDFYLNTNTGALYQKKADGWGSPILTLKGEQGKPGRDGVLWYSGNGNPNTLKDKTVLAGSIVGDFYLDTENFEVYQKTSEAEWTNLGSLTGATGARGAKWFYGSALPEAAPEIVDVQEGDSYFRSYVDETAKVEKYQIYSYEGGTWNLKATIKASDLSGLFGSDGTAYFHEDEEKGTVVVTGTAVETPKLAIPGSINGKPVEVAKDAFKNNKTLQSVVFEEGLVGIGEGAFSGCSELSDITIPESVTSIGKDAFKDTAYYQDEENWPDGVLYIDKHLIAANSKFAGGDYKVKADTTMIADYAFNACKTLKSIEIPKTVKAIGIMAFNNCSALESANIPQGVKKIEKQVFYYCSALKGIDIPDSVTSIESMAFQGCTNLATVTIGSGIKTIGSSAFHSCKALTSIVIPEGAKEIGSSAFNNCSNLAHIELPHGLTSIGQSAFSTTKYYNEKSNWDTNYYYDLLYIGSYLITRDSANFHTNRPKAVSIREGTEGLADYALSNCSRFTSIAIPASVTMIGNGAFNDCSNLTQITLAPGNPALKMQDNCLFGTETHILYWVNPTSASIEIPSGITTIGSSMFSECENLKSITIPKSVKVLEDAAFFGCTSLTSLSFEEDSELTSIGYQAFFDCSGLESVIIPDSVTSIGGSAFRRCTSLKELTLGKNISSIGNLAFDGCSELTTVNWNVKNCKNFTSSSSSRIFSGCTKLTTVNFGAEVQAIPEYAFYSCSSITTVTFAENGALTAIGTSAFNGCALLEGLELPEGVTTIGANAFNGCSALDTIVLPESLTEIGSNAFSGSGLKELTLGKNVASLGDNAFKECKSLVTVNWNAAECTIVKSSMMSTVFQGCTALTTAIFGEEVKSIPSYLFYQNGSYESPLRTVTFNCTALETIGEGAFIYCRSLSSDIVIPDTVTSIGAYAFQGCYELTNVTIGKGVKTIGTNAFNNCTALATVTWNATACETTGTSSNGIFGSNKALTTFNVGADVQSVPANALKSVTTIKTINFGGTAEEFDALLAKGNFLSSISSVTVTCNGGTYTYARGVRQS